MESKSEAGQFKGNLTEHEAKAFLEKNGISTPRGIVARALPGKVKLNYPLALKVSDPGILHKSDVGGVKTGISSHDELAEQFRLMSARFPGSEFLIEEMAPKGTEFIVGVARDPVFGPVLMLGTGGVYTELYHDVAFRKVPISEVDARHMLHEIKSGAFCNGFRGTRVDCGRIVDLLLRVSRMVTESPVEIESMDLNPVIAWESGTVVADAKLSFRKQ